MRIIVWLLSFMCALCGFAYVNTDSESGSIRIENVSYEYVMTSSDSDGTTKYYCNGPILFDVLFPNTTKLLVIRRTRNHFVRDDGRIFWGIMSKYDIENSTVKSLSFPGVSWGMYIEASAYDDNGKWLCSDTICTNDYINSEDLRLVTATSSITETKISEPKVYLSESNIIVETDQLTDLWIYDTCGICLMHHNISSRIAIPVGIYGHKFLIVRTATENGVKTTKLNL